MGKLLYQVVRLHSPKDFRPRYPDHASLDGWTWKKSPNQVLYHLQEVIDAPIVFLAEGERDVETLRSYGFCATCEAGGANAPWLDCYTDTLAGREVTIIPDNDEPGWKRAKRVARALLGSAARIRVLELPTKVKDVTEWFEGGHSECELIAKLEGVDAV
jgi:putative DNA primase/helicase